MRLIETCVTELEMRSWTRIEPPRPRTEKRLRVETVVDISADFYRLLYDGVGRAHHWTSRDLPDAILLSEIRRHGISVHVLHADDEPAGWFELDSARRPFDTRIVHFGILPAFRGLGLSAILLVEAIEAAFRTRPVVVSLETNTLDHPAALPLYKRYGFVVVGERMVSTRAIDDD